LFYSCVFFFGGCVPFVSAAFCFSFLGLLFSYFFGVVLVIFRFFALFFSVFWVLIQFAYGLFWVSTLALAFDKYNGASLFWICLFLLFSFYWTAQVLKNCLHVTIAGVFASYYFLSGTSSMPNHPLPSAAGRAFGRSFGSICFGSLVVALIQTLRALARSLRDQAAWLACILDCILGCIEGIVKYLNHWAYSQVAIYGKSYCQAAKATMSLFHRVGLDAIVQDNFIDSVLNVAIMLTCCLCLGIGYGVGKNNFTLGEEEQNVDDAVIFAWYCAIGGLLVGGYMMVAFMEVINSGCACTFVCLAEDPAALRRTKPEILNQMQATYQWVVPTNV